MTKEQQAEYDRWYEEQIQLGLDDLEAGRVHTDAQVWQHIEERRRELQAQDQRNRGKAA